MVTKLCRLVSFIFRFLIYISKKQPLAAELISSYIGSLLVIDQSITMLVHTLSYIAISTKIAQEQLRN